MAWQQLTRQCNFGELVILDENLINFLTRPLSSKDALSLCLRPFNSHIIKARLGATVASNFIEVHLLATHLRINVE